MGTKQELAIRLSAEMELAPLGVSPETFSNMLMAHDLTYEDGIRIIAIRSEYQASITYIGKMLETGHTLRCVEAAYQLRNVIGVAPEPNGNFGGVVSEFELSIEKTCALLDRMFPGYDQFDDELVESVADFLQRFAEQCEQNRRTWSGFMEVIFESWEALEAAERARTDGLLEQTPEERVQAWLDLLLEIS